MRPALANNLLLGRFAAHDRQALLREGEPVNLQAGAQVMTADQRLSHVHFPIDCAVSLLIEAVDRPLLEIGLIGREGMLGVPLILGVRQSNVSGYVQTPGLAWRIEAARFGRCLDSSERLRRQMQRYVQVHMTQLTEATACKYFHKLAERLARWLLMSADRLQSNELALTHEYLSHVLGVRRAGTTLAARALQERGLIEYSRGHIVLLDRAGLESAVCPCYAREDAVREPHALTGPRGNPTMRPVFSSQSFMRAQARLRRRSSRSTLGRPDRFVRGSQPVVWNARSEMVDVVITDVRGEPAQHGWQVVERAAFDRRTKRAPGFAALPVSFLEGVLHVEQPDADRAGQHHNRQMHRERHSPSDHCPQERAKGEQGEIVQGNAAPFLLPAPW